MSRAIGRRKSRADSKRIGTRILFGEMVNHDATTVLNFRDKIELQAGFDAVRLIYAVSQNVALDASNLQIAGANVYSPSNKSSAPAFGQIPAATFNGSATVTKNAPAAAARVAYLISDWIPLVSTARDDGGAGSILIVRTTVVSAAKLVIRGSLQTGYTTTAAWEASTDGRYWSTKAHSTFNTGSSEASWVNGTSTASSPLMGVEYLARGRVISIGASGDSTVGGLGDTRLGAGYPVAAANLLAAASGLPVEVANTGWQGQTMAQIANRAIDFCAARPERTTDQPLKPSFFFQGIGSWNGVPAAGNPNPLLATDVDINRRGYATAALAFDAAGIPVLSTDWYCFNNTAKDVTFDSRREAYNAEVAGYGINFTPCFASVAGDLDGDGQRQYAVGMTTDGAHPNAAGYLVVGAAALPDVQAILGL